MAIFHHIIQPSVTVTHSSNTHTVDLDKRGNNYSVSINSGAANIIGFSNLDATRVGKAGSILIQNPGSMSNTTITMDPGNAYTPGGSTINFNLTASATAVLTYHVYASNKILLNYVGKFELLPQP
tara:strand:+ start:340 stop:714 length:375 start_codon:yes stop_codon:yes gene_type:complete